MKQEPARNYVRPLSGVSEAGFLLAPLWPLQLSAWVVKVSGAVLDIELAALNRILGRLGVPPARVDVERCLEDGPTPLEQFIGFDDLPLYDRSE